MRTHQLSLSSYEVLLQLALAPGRRLKMTALAKGVLLSPSGLTRVVDQLQREGLVTREQREDDGRSLDTVLTTDGQRRLRVINHRHLERVRELFLDHLSEAQLEQLTEIWSALEPRTMGDEVEVTAR
jgi:DNA-binding MarR family transcriptional regulator